MVQNKQSQEVTLLCLETNSFYPFLFSDFSLLFNLYICPSWKFSWHLVNNSCWIFILQDDSRRIASTLFPSLSPLLSRKKDHGTYFCCLIHYSTTVPVGDYTVSSKCTTREMLRPQGTNPIPRNYTLLLIIISSTTKF